MTLLRSIKFLCCGCSILTLQSSIGNHNGFFNEIGCIRDTIFRVYHHLSPDGHAGSAIKLKNDKTFSYSTGTDVQQFTSSGKWEIKNDTLILNSFLKRDDIPFVIKESAFGSLDSLTIAWVKNLNGDVVKDATVFVNDDTSASCMPVFDNCVFPIGSVKKLRFTFNNCSTDWYFLKNMGANKIEPVVNVDFYLDGYVFLHNQKYFMTKSGLYELKESIDRSNGQEPNSLIRDPSLFYKRIKS